LLRAIFNPNNPLEVNVSVGAGFARKGKEQSQAKLAPTILE
jgi:hypothetical protein